MNELVGFTRAQRFWAFAALLVCFVIVGGSAAVTSFGHIEDVAIIGHQSAFLALLYPLIIDGMMGIASVAMWQDRKYGRNPRPWARFTFWFGLLVSVAANVTSVVAVWGWDWIGIAIAGFPPVGLLCSVEIMTKPGRVRQVAQMIATVQEQVGRVVTPAGPVAPPAPVTDLVTPPPVADEATPSPVADVVADEGTPAVVVPAGAVAGVVAGVVSAGRRARPDDDGPLPEELVALAREVGGQWRERTGREITRDGLRTGLRERGWQRGISNVTAGRLLDLIRADADGQADTEQNTARVTASSNGH